MSAFDLVPIPTAPSTPRRATQGGSRRILRRASPAPFPLELFSAPSTPQVCCTTACGQRLQALRIDDAQVNPLALAPEPDLRPESGNSQPRFCPVFGIEVAIGAIMARKLEQGGEDRMSVDGIHVEMDLVEQGPFKEGPLCEQTVELTPEKPHFWGRETSPEPFGEHETIQSACVPGPDLETTSCRI